MSYRLLFKPKAKKEWDKLGATIKEQFKKKLAERLEAPEVRQSRLTGITDCYKIKLKQAGYRLVYQVDNEEVLVLVLAIGKRERNAVYKSAIKRI